MPGLRLARRLLPLAVCLLPAAALGQRPAGRPPVWLEYAVDDELENYLRSLQALGDVPVHPWSLRGFSPVELDRLHPRGTAHPWRERLGGADSAGLRAALLRPRLDTRYNSTFPHGGNDGAVWAGRGVTAAVSAGAALRWGPLSVALSPIAFWTQNQDFPILDNGRTGAERFGDGVFPGRVDRPQRFGDAAYHRLDPGQSTIRLDAYGATVGFSTANQWWGPAQEYPFLLSNNAAGFPHLFVGTSTPANLWIARVHARVLWGRLEQSDYFVPVGPVMRPRRFATGLALVVAPRGMEYLELGGARFFHAPWPDEGMPGRYVWRTFEGLLKESLPEVGTPIQGDSRSLDGENQLASVFARLLLPGTGFEVYGEFGREDHPWDLRYLLLAPDEQSSLTLGLRKTWRRAEGSLAVLRAEFLNFRQSQVDRVRGGSVIYLHDMGSNQGHTQRGQLLGADVGVGSGAGTLIGVDLYGRGGRTTMEWRRVIRQERGALGPGGTENPRALDVVHSLGVERLLFRGTGEIGAGVELSHNFNRDFVRDRTNLTLRLTATGLPW